MRFSAILLALAASTNPDISVFDSKTRPGTSWVLVGDCAVQVKTTDFQNNPEKIIKKINDFCKLELDDVNKEN